MHALRFITPKILIPFRAVRVNAALNAQLKVQSIREISTSSKAVTTKTAVKLPTLQAPRILSCVQVLRKITNGQLRQFCSAAGVMALHNITFQFAVAEDKLSDDVLLKNFTTGRSSFEAATLVSEVPEGKPTFPLKKIVYDLATKGREFAGTLKASRYKLFPVEKVSDQTFYADLKQFPTNKFEVDLRQDIFDYIRTDNNDTTVEWHVNFAGTLTSKYFINRTDPYLFTAFSGPLFAQDEIQVSEMPVLGHLRKLLDKKTTHSPENQLLPFTRKHGEGTPMLIRGIQRFCNVDTDSNALEGRPYGLYGNAFSRHKPEVIEKATKIINPPQIVNMIAMSALPGGHGEYSKDEIIDTFTTAYTSFRAAKLESQLQVNQEDIGGAIVPKVVVHTGNWGTGAFGGSKPLMAAIQLSAAHMAGVDKVVFHSFNKEGTDGFKEGEQVYKQLLDGKNPTFEEFVAGLKSCRYRWGFSDGN